MAAGRSGYKCQTPMHWHLWGRASCHGLPRVPHSLPCGAVALPPCLATGPQQSLCLG